MLYTSHYMEEVEKLCPRICIMDAGKVIADGSVDEVTGRVITEEVVNLEVKEPAPSLSEALLKIQGVKNCKVAGRHAAVISKAGSQNIARILEAAGPYGVISVNTPRPTLEDAFLALTGKKLRDNGGGENA